MHAPAEDIVCGEVGCPDGQRWSEPARLTGEELQALEAFQSDGVVELRDSAGGLEIAGTDHVGTAILPTRRRLHIRPKIGDVALLDWLTYVGEIPPLSPRTAGEGFALRGSFPEVVAHQFLSELHPLTRRLRATFVPQGHDAATVRGRILSHALARSYHRLPNLPQSRRVRTLDTPHHRLLAAALDRVTLLLPRSPTLDALVRDWEDVPRHPLDHAIDPGPPGYASALRLALLILLGASPARDPRASAGALLVSLASVWERALRRLCAEVAKDSGWTTAADAQRTKRWDDGPGLRDPLRWMTADVLLCSGDRRWVLDAKYKRGYGDEERNDRFQMTAYAMAFNARRATLVYPTADCARPRWRLLLAGQIAGQSTTIDSIELPMALGPAACRAALLDALVALGPAPVKSAPAPRILLDA